MLVLYTKMFLRNEVSEKNIDEIMLKWVTGSPHFHFDDLQKSLLERKNDEQGIESVEKQQKFYSLHYDNSNTLVHVYRLDNIDNRVLWSTECIFVQENDEKYITVTLNCDLQEYNSRLPHKHKPYIIRLLIESGFCKYDGSLPVSDKVIPISENNISDIVDIMKGRANNFMPLVYVSKDYDSYALDVNQLAIWLSGFAHVVVEEEKKWTHVLKERTDGRNAHNGFIGIYYPQNQLYELFAKNSYFQDRDMAVDISCTVQQAIVNYQSEQEYNWNRVIFLKTKDKWRKEGEQKETELDEFMRTFQPLNDDLSEKVRSLNAQLEIYKSMIKNSKEAGCLLDEGNEQEFYVGEKQDFLLTLLHCTKERMDKDTRGYELLISILEANEFHNHGKKILSELKTILYRGGKLNKSSKSDLKNIGFDVIEEKGHPKLIFHNNQKYKFPISGTPGSGRDGKNLYSDICEKIDIYKKPI